jgi:NitT/TauT family transport system substrate-binding protein
MLRVVFSLLISSLVLFPGASRGQEKAKTERLRIAIPSRGIPFFPILAAQRYGLYAAEGFATELIVMTPGISVQALLAGDLDFVSVPNLAATAAISGVPVQQVMAINVGPGHSLVVKSDIRSVEDLRGKTLAIASHKDMIDFATRIALRKHGLRPDADVQLFTIGNQPLRYTALESGRVDGTLLESPLNKAAIKKGFRELLHLRDYIAVHSAGLATHTRRVQTDADFIMRAIRATLKGTKLLKSDKDAFFKLLAAEARIDDKELAAAIYGDAVRILSDTGVPTDAAMNEAIRFAKETRGTTREVAINEVADFSLARRVLREAK